MFGRVYPAGFVVAELSVLLLDPVQRESAVLRRFTNN